MIDQVQLPPSEAFTSAPPAPSGADPTGRMRIRLAEAEAAAHPGGLTDISGVLVPGLVLCITVGSSVDPLGIPGNQA